jgi:hypothetical protein
MRFRYWPCSRYPLADQSWIRPLVFPPTTWSTRLGWLAVTAGTAVTLCESQHGSTDRGVVRSGGPVVSRNIPLPRRTHASVQSDTILSPVAATTSRLRFMLPTVKWGM